MFAPRQMNVRAVREQLLQALAEESAI